MVNSVCAVVVTYNRKALLDKCLNAIINQSVKPNKIIVIDNASTDGTQDLLQKKYNNLICNIRMNQNTGGAGGFYEGIKIASQENYDWVWVMDDDTIPSCDCLMKLLEAKDIVLKNDINPAFFASAIFGKNNECMNVPLIDECIEDNGYPAWYRYLENSIVTIKCATFVSVLFNGKAIKKCGLPYKDFFIWGDDSEYTFRMNKYYGKGYFIGNSVAIHLRNNAISLAKDVIMETNIDKIKRFHYYYRNMSLIGFCYGKSSQQMFNNVKLLLSGLKFLMQKNGIRKYTTMVVGIFESLVEKRKLRRYIYEQIND